MYLFIRNYFVVCLLLLLCLKTSAQEFGFCSENIPQDNTYAIAKLQDYISIYQNKYKNIHKQYNNYFQKVGPILRKYKIPDDFIFLPIVESGYCARAISPVGAYGYWQLMKQTAREQGLAVNDFIDQRENLIESTHAACRVLKYLYSELGSWTLAAAAYNYGIGNIKKIIQYQKTDDYYNMKLNKETAEYVYKIIAIKEIYLNSSYWKNKKSSPPTLSNENEITFKVASKQVEQSNFFNTFYQKEVKDTVQLEKNIKTSNIEIKTFVLGDYKKLTPGVILRVRIAEKGQMGEKNKILSCTLLKLQDNYYLKLNNSKNFYCPINNVNLLSDGKILIFSQPAD